MTQGTSTMNSFKSQGGTTYDIFKLDTYSYGVTLQICLLGEDGAVRKRIRKKGYMMLPMDVDESDNLEMLRASHANGRISAECLDLLENKLLPFKPAERARLASTEVVNH